MKSIFRFSLIAASSLIISCGDKGTDVTTVEPSTSLLDSYYAAEAPAGAKQISQVFPDATPGKEVVLSGEIMGRTDPLMDGRAMVVLGDPTQMTPCNRIPGDECPTPWDVCCDDSEVIKKSITTIQFLDDEGKVLREGLRGYRGIKELSFLTVKGTIAEGSNPENLLITASEFHVTDPSPYVNASPVGLDGVITIEDGAFIYTEKKESE